MQKYKKLKEKTKDDEKCWVRIFYLSKLSYEVYFMIVQNLKYALSVFFVFKISPLLILRYKGLKIFVFTIVL